MFLKLFLDVISENRAGCEGFVFMQNFKYYYLYNINNSEVVWFY